MDINHAFEQIGYFFAFWLAWKAFDFTLHLSIHKWKGQDKKEMTAKAFHQTQMETLNQADAANKAIQTLARGLATVVSDVKTVKDGLKAITPQPPTLDFKDQPAKKKRTIKVGSRKVDPIPLADEVPAEPVKKSKAKQKSKKVEGSYTVEVIAKNGKKTTVADTFRKRVILPEIKKSFVCAFEEENLAG